MSFFFRSRSNNDPQKHQEQEQENNNLDDSSNMIETTTGDLSGGIDDLISDLEAEEQSLIKKSKEKQDSGSSFDTASGAQY